MSDKQNSMLEEEREPLSKGWIFAGIVLSTEIDNVSKIIKH